MLYKLTYTLLYFSVTSVSKQAFSVSGANQWNEPTSDVIVGLQVFPILMFVRMYLHLTHSDVVREIILLSTPLRCSGGKIPNRNPQILNLWTSNPKSQISKSNQIINLFPHLLFSVCIVPHLRPITLMKISKTSAIRSQILRLKCIEFNFSWGSGGAYSAPTDLLAVFKGSTTRKQWEGRGTGYEK